MNKNICIHCGVSADYIDNQHQYIADKLCSDCLKQLNDKHRRTSINACIDCGNKASYINNQHYDFQYQLCFDCLTSVTAD